MSPKNSAIRHFQIFLGVNPKIMKTHMYVLRLICSNISEETQRAEYVTNSFNKMSFEEKWFLFDEN